MAVVMWALLNLNFSGKVNIITIGGGQILKIPPVDYKNKLKPELRAAQPNLTDYLIYNF